MSNCLHKILRPARRACWCRRIDIFGAGISGIVAEMADPKRRLASGHDKDNVGDQTSQAG